MDKKDNSKSDLEVREVKREFVKITEKIISNDNEAILAYIKSAFEKHRVTEIHWTADSFPEITYIKEIEAK